MDTRSTPNSVHSSSARRDPGSRERRSHHYGVLFALALTLVAASAHAQTGDVVILPSGERIVGTVVEHEVGTRVVIRAADGTTRSLGPGEFSSVTFEDPSRPPDRASAVPSAGFVFVPGAPRDEPHEEESAAPAPSVVPPASSPPAPSAMTAGVVAPETPASAAPPARPASVPTARRYDPHEEPPSRLPRGRAPGPRSNPAFVVGIVLGGSGVVGGLSFLLGGLVSAARSDSGGGLFVAGAVVAPIGALAVLVSVIALVVDRASVRSTFRASTSPSGGTLSLDVAF